MAQITLRRATLADVPALRHWDEDPVLIAAGGQDAGEWNWEIEIPRQFSWYEPLIAERDGRAIGFIQIIDPQLEETHYWGDIEPGFRAIDIWIGVPEDRRKGYGRQMMRLALGRCFATPEVKAVLIDPLASNTAARRFYESLDFYNVGLRRFGEDACMVMQLDRADWAKTALP
jgi:aminoglycoside 6'-N-acetyltransferase